MYRKLKGIQRNATLSPQANICIVTPDLLGPVRNGGIGTACAFLAESLADAGCRVSLLFTQCGTTANVRDVWASRYLVQGIHVEVAEAWRAQMCPSVFPAHPPLKMAYTVHDWLAERSFDVVFFMEWQGNGFYAMQAKRAGLRFQDSAFVTITHSPSLWHAVNNADLPTDPLMSLTYFMERKSVEWADQVVSPSVYMLNWLRRYGFNPPARSVVLPNLIKFSSARQATPSNTKVLVNELVFFGRLEYRKGLMQFCDALDRLAALGGKPSKVTFLGKFSRIGQEHSGVYIARRSEKWPFPIEIRARLNQAEAINYLQDAARLAVMPSVADNLPYTVYECLVAGIPFLARNVGGVRELIDIHDHDNCLFDDNPNTLAQRLFDILGTGAKVARIAFDLDENVRSWINLVDDLSPRRKSTRPRKPRTPMVSVCLTHYNRPKLLKQAINSLMVQDYPNFEVILVDDGSTDNQARATLRRFEPVFAERGWLIVQQKNGYLGKARNTAVEHANGEFILFMDDDNVARSNMISRFVQAALGSNADLVTAVFDVFTGRSLPTPRTKVVERFLPVGDVLSYSLVTNVIGDANALMKRNLFDKLGGFSEDYGIGHEDFELYLRAVLVGAKVCVVPEPLFWYRRHGGSMLNATHAAANRMRSLRPFLDAFPAPLAELAVLAHGSMQGKMAFDHLTKDEIGVLSNEDLECLLNCDPNAPETVAVLAKALIAHGQGGLVERLLDDFAETGSQADKVRGMAANLLLKAAKAGDVKAVNANLRAFGRSQAARLRAAYACQIALRSICLSASDGALVASLARGLASGRPDSISGQLDAASAFAQSGKIEEALDCFVRALEIAGVVYLKKRPDVAAAVIDRQFASALDHYVRHGLSEGCTWPESFIFEHVCRDIHSQISPRLDGLSPLCRQLFALAISAFLNEGNPPGIESVQK